ncbi:MAG TPA: hypothetical protein DCO86_01615 [Spirochaetaceae bacterium]|nr:hypothetical protein [Spirochaetaceae bacterium]
MRLVSLDMVGFKSFAEKTHIEFSDGITCVVGENGNGKTCILEAIVWVLGSQAGSAVRAVKGVGMGSVIFWGNKTREMSQFAEVSIVFSNEDRALPIDTSEVEIRRRISISGFRSKSDFDTESEYFINRTPCRLKDINDLLANTGVGKNSYSILEQGETDKILNMKPEERRSIFEEAAAISKYRMDEKEAQAKLAAADENLKDVNVRYAELQRQYSRLKNQAEDATNYINDKKELRELEDKSVVLELNEIEAKKEDHSDQLKRNKEKLKALEEKSRSLTEKKTENEKLLSALREEIGILNGEIQSASQSMSSSQEMLKGFLDSRSNLEASYGEIKSRRESAHEAERENRELKKALDAEIAELKSQSEDIAEKISKAQSEDEEVRERIRSLEEEGARMDEEKSSLESKLFDNYEQFVSNAHDVISLVYKEIKDDKNAVLKGDLEKKLVEKLSELKSAMEGADALSSDDLHRMRAILDDILSFFDEYRNLHVDFSKLRKSYKSVEEAKKADDVVTPLFDRISRIGKSAETCRRSIKEASDKRNTIQLSISSFSAQKQAVGERLIELNVKRDVAQKEFESIKSRIDEVDKDEKSAKKMLDDNIANVKRLQVETAKLDKEMDKKIKERDSREARKAKIEAELSNMGGKDSVDMQNLIERNAMLTAKIENFDELMKRISDEYFEREGVDVQDLRKTVRLGEKDELQSIKRRTQFLRNQIKSYGNINYLAAEEFKGVSEEYNLVKRNLEDYAKAREDLKVVLTNIQTENTRLFMETFDKINENFNIFYSALSGGGSARLELGDSQDALQSGVEIYACPPGKSATHVSSLSGGERTMVTLALFFAIYQIRPAPFCFLDEPVAALSEKNVNAFLNMLRDFKDTSQFIMITHNKYTLKGGNALIGVVQHEKGVSKVLSCNLRVTDDGKFLLTDRNSGKPLNLHLE